MDILTLDEIKKELEVRKIIITDKHVVFTSGKHGTAYVNKDRIYPFTELTRSMCQHIAFDYKDSNIDTVIAPAVGGVILSTWVSYWLQEFTGKPVFCTYADKDPDPNNPKGFVIGRGYSEFVQAKKVLALEDIINTGGSIVELIKTVNKTIGEGKIIGIGALCNRGGSTAETLGVPKLYSVINVSMEAFDQKDCQMCRRKVPVYTGAGHGETFLKSETGIAIYGDPNTIPETQLM